MESSSLLHFPCFLQDFVFEVLPLLLVSHFGLTVDIEHLLLESDGPVKYSGKDGTPAMIKDVLKSISKFKDVPIDDLEKQIYENTKKVFPRIFK